MKSVEVALRRLAGRRCRWYYPSRGAFVRGSCAKPRFFKAVVNDFTWSYTFSRRVVPGIGRYQLRVRATDTKGNATKAFSSAAHTLVGFRIVR